MVPEMKHLFSAENRNIQGSNERISWFAIVTLGGIKIKGTRIVDRGQVQLNGRKPCAGESAGSCASGSKNRKQEKEGSNRKGFLMTKVRQRIVLRVGLDAKRNLTVLSTKCFQRYTSLSTPRTVTCSRWPKK